ncbi:unnamed protein product [Gongylonema pulchrum]|uniref:Uncharacterized protein n=1 Tax=Gongylonema pulchrum TaxID=637853 RepID=A0A183DJD5_9BILA|nr:unnamed protein product [Gongylonema pulchrum]
MKAVIQLKQKVNETLAALQALVDRNRLSIGCKLNGALRGKVINLYMNAREACEAEANFVRKLLEDIEKLRRMRYATQRSGLLARGELMQLLMQRARHIPLWIGPPDMHPPPLVGAIPAPASMALKVMCLDVSINYLVFPRH